MIKKVESRNREKRVLKKKVSESSFQKTVLDFLKTLPNCYAIKTIRTNRSGTPDIIMCLNGKFIGLELKREGEKPEKIQYHHLVQIEGCGGIGLWTSPSRWQETKAILENYSKYPVTYA